jgi:hypothetical protein
MWGGSTTLAHAAQGAASAHAAPRGSGILPITLNQAGLTRDGQAHSPSPHLLDQDLVLPGAALAFLAAAIV